MSAAWLRWDARRALDIRTYQGRFQCVMRRSLSAARGFGSRFFFLLRAVVLIGAHDAARQWTPHRLSRLRPRRPIEQLGCDQPLKLRKRFDS